MLFNILHPFKIWQLWVTRVVTDANDRFIQYAPLKMCSPNLCRWYASEDWPPTFQCTDRIFLHTDIQIRVTTVRACLAYQERSSLNRSCVKVWANWSGQLTSPPLICDNLGKCSKKEKTRKESTIKCWELIFFPLSWSLLKCCTFILKYMQMTVCRRPFWYYQINSKDGESLIMRTSHRV